MKRKVTRRKVVRKNGKSFHHIFVGYSITLFGAICLFLISTVTLNAWINAHVLGDSTYSAQGGSDSGEHAGMPGEQQSGPNEQKNNEPPHPQISPDTIV